MSGHIYTQSEIFAVVRQLLKKYHAESAILFGSYARQEADAASDIDLIVVGGSKFDPTDIFCIAEELHRTMGKAVDVYELREVNAVNEARFSNIFIEKRASTCPQSLEKSRLFSYALLVSECENFQNMKRIFLRKVVI